jgi:hypothetical protein
VAGGFEVMLIANSPIEAIKSSKTILDNSRLKKGLGRLAGFGISVSFIRGLGRTAKN